MAKKTLGYILAGAGLIVFFISYSGLRALIGVSIPENFSDTYLTLIGAILLVIGIYMAFKGSKQVREIPIYEGHGKHRQVVGIQRVNN